MTTASRNSRQVQSLEASNTEAFRELWQRKLTPLVPDRAGKTIMALRWYHWRETNLVTLKDKRHPGKRGYDLLEAATGRSRSACARDVAKFEDLGFVRRIPGDPFDK